MDYCAPRRVSGAVSRHYYEVLGGDSFFHADRFDANNLSQMEARIEATIRCRKVPIDRVVLKQTRTDPYTPGGPYVLLNTECKEYSAYLTLPRGYQENLVESLFEFSWETFNKDPDLVLKERCSWMSGTVVKDRSDGACDGASSTSDSCEVTGSECFRKECALGRWRCRDPSQNGSREKIPLVAVAVTFPQSASLISLFKHYSERSTYLLQYFWTKLLLHARLFGLDDEEEYKMLESLDWYQDVTQPGYSRLCSTLLQPLYHMTTAPHCGTSGVVIHFARDMCGIDDRNTLLGVLAAAILADQKDVIHALLTHQSDSLDVGLPVNSPLTARGASRCMLLHFAAYGSTAVMRLLLELGKGYDVNTREELSGNNTSSMGRTPLHIASQVGNTEMVKLLLDYGADARLPAVVSVEKNFAEPALLAARRGHLESVKAILQHASNLDDERKITVGKTTLRYAAESGDLPLLECLLLCGLDVNLKISEIGAPPLLRAAISGQLGMVDSLIRHGAKTEMTDFYGGSALHYAVGHPEILRYLLVSHGFPADAKTRNRSTALFTACSENHAESVAVLLHHDASPNAQNHTGDTPLHIAAKLNRTDVIRQLLDKGADSTVRNIGGVSPLEEAVRVGSLDALVIFAAYQLDSRIKDPSGALLRSAVGNGHHKAVQTLLEMGSDPNLKDERGYTALHLAAQTGCLHTVKLLHARGADLNAKSKTGQTSLDVAIQHRQESVLDWLVENGAAKQ